ncbi:hypothetical protein EEL32_07805 [Brevibacillus laterosporus]|uniref:Uncharacterized protein n=1 Tax=Brevibacillus laterosporus TaxID=1465 RepID=A0A502ISX1_BRELA|nr:hypothetical protein EEL30_19115 [Brevibacillus laterosporus]TPG68145.1 hypothetical protein EEL31_06075 [Brevibacillus laterosporus]TPG88842.1 hypothetical protein EEL32_07805 [Brevibacillus laterosporus]
MQNQTIKSKRKRMIYPLLIMVFVAVCFTFLNFHHVRNYKLTEMQSQDCKEAGGVPEVSNTWGGLGFTFTCKTKDAL